MDKKSVINHYGSQTAVADALGISQASISKWKTVPELRQLKLEALTGGALKADKSILPSRVSKSRRKAKEFNMPKGVF